MLAVLRQRDYRLMLLGLAVSEIGTIMLYTTLPFYVFVRTGSALATGAKFWPRCCRESCSVRSQESWSTVGALAGP